VRLLLLVIGLVLASSASAFAQKYDPTTGEQIVQCANCGGSGGGTSAVDEAAFTFGTTPYTPGGGVYNPSGGTLTAGQGGAFAVTNDRSLFIDLNRVGGSLITLGQTTKSASVPVTVASDQGPIGYTDGAGFAYGSSNQTTAGCVYNASITNLTTGETGAVSCTPDRGLYFNLDSVGGSSVTLGAHTTATSIPVTLPTNAATLPVIDTAIVNALAPVTLAGTNAGYGGAIQGTTGGVPVPIAPTGWTATDGSVTITTGGTAQNLFSGATPTHSWEVNNPNASDVCWVSDTTTAAVNGKGSRQMNPGGGWVNPPGRNPTGAVSVLCPTTNDVLTASEW